MLYEDTWHKRKNERKRNNLNIQRGRRFCIIRAGAYAATREMDYKSTGVREKGDEGEREYSEYVEAGPLCPRYTLSSPVAIRENKTVKTMKDKMYKYSVYICTAHTLHNLFTLYENRCGIWCRNIIRGCRARGIRDVR